MHIVATKSSTALCVCLALGSLASLTGCPAQQVCPPCFVGDVQAPDTKPNPAPNATINLQLDRSLNRQGAVSEVHVTLTDARGNTETLTYGSDKVSGLNSSSMTTINDNAAYDVNGQAPVRADVEIVFVNGYRASDDMAVRTE
jgi:hypothetical protein